MGQLSIEVRPKLARMVPLLGSDKPGEVLAAADAICRTLRSAGSDLHDLADAIVIKIEPVRRSPGGGHRPAEAYAMWPAYWSQETPCWVMDGLRTGLRDGIFYSEFERTFARDIADKIDCGNCRFSGRQIETINNLLAKLRRGKRTTS